MVQTLLIRCSDPRLNNATRRFIERLESDGQSCYVISVLGSSLALMETDGRPFFRHQLEKAHKLGPIQRVVILHHLDCRYCAERKFIDFDAEVEYHQQQMEAANSNVANELTWLQNGAEKIELPQFDIALGIHTEDDESATGENWAILLNSEIVTSLR
ncbi:hypothetical protein ACFL04_04105 [Patescibacteria group bacterium]